MKFTQIITTLAFFATFASQPLEDDDTSINDITSRVKRADSRPVYRVLYFRGGVAEAFAQEFSNSNYKDNISHTRKIYWNEALNFYDETTRAAAIWNSEKRRIIKSWKPWYNVYNVDNQFNFYADGINLDISM